MPPEQSAIETDFKRELKSRYDIVFNNLYTITNMPIARYFGLVAAFKKRAKLYAKVGQFL